MVHICTNKFLQSFLSENLSLSANFLGHNSLGSHVVMYTFRVFLGFTMPLYNAFIRCMWLEAMIQNCTCCICYLDDQQIQYRAILLSHSYFFSLQKL